MDIAQLKQFITAAEEENFTRAAEQLFMSRQALSKSIHNLERELGQTLFNANSNRLELTEKGRTFFADAIPAVRAYDELANKYGSASLYNANTLDLVATYAYSAALPPSFFDQIREENPGIAITIDETFSDGVLETVRSGGADIGILGSCPAFLQDVDYLRLDNLSICVHVPSTSELASLDTLSLGDLEGMPMVTAGKRDHLHRLFLQQCREAHITPDVILSTTDTKLLFKTVEEKQAAYFGFPSHIVPIPVEGYIARKLFLPGSEAFGTYAIRRRGSTFGKTALSFWHSLKQLSFDRTVNVPPSEQ